MEAAVYDALQSQVSSKFNNNILIVRFIHSIDQSNGRSRCKEYLENWISFCVPVQDTNFMFTKTKFKVHFICHSDYTVHT